MSLIRNLRSIVIIAKNLHEINSNILTQVSSVTSRLLQKQEHFMSINRDTGTTTTTTTIVTNYFGTKRITKTVVVKNK